MARAGALALGVVQSTGTGLCHSLIESRMTPLGLAVAVFGGAQAEVLPRGEHGPCPPRAPPSDDLQRPSATSDQLVNDRHRRDRIMQSAAAIGSRWMSHLQLAQLGSKQWSCPRTVLPISVGIGTIRAVRHLVPRDIVLDAAVRDGEAQPWTRYQYLSPRARLRTPRAEWGLQAPSSGTTAVRLVDDDQDAARVLANWNWNLCSFSVDPKPPRMRV